MSRKEQQLRRKAKTAIKTISGKIHNQTLYFETDNFSIRALTTLEDLKNESVTMSNCVANQWFKAYQKEFLHFHIELNNMPYTLSIDPKTHDLVDIAGIGNAEVSQEICNTIFNNFYLKYWDKLKDFVTANSALSEIV